MVHGEYFFFVYSFSLHISVVYLVFQEEYKALGLRHLKKDFKDVHNLLAKMRLLSNIRTRLLRPVLGFFLTYIVTLPLLVSNTSEDPDSILSTLTLDKLFSGP